MAKGYILTKSKYIRGLQCEKAMYLDVYKPKLAFYPPETLAKFKEGRIFEKTFKDTFPHGVDISAQLRYRMDEYPLLTAKLLKRPGETALFEAGFLYNEVLVLADVVHKHEDGSIDIYEVKNSGAVSNTFCNDIGIQNYVIQHALLSIRPDDLFCKGLTLKHFYLLYNNGEGGFVKEDLLEQAQAACNGIEQNVTHFKQVLHADEPHMPMSEHCDTPYECPYKRYCKRLKAPSRETDTP